MTSLYKNKILRDWTTNHTDPARLALFDYRAYYMTLFNIATRYAGLWRRGMALASRAVHPGFDTHRTLCGIGNFLLLHYFGFFFISFYHNG